MRIAIPLCAALLASAGAAPAEAASVTSKDDGMVHRTLGPQYTATFAAAPGEQNNLTVRFANNQYVFSEAALALNAGSYCTQLSAGSAGCQPGMVVIDAGDGDDRIDSGVAAQVDGAAGNDVLSGGGAQSGGPGVDVITAKAVTGPGVYGSSTLIIDAGQGERDTYVGARGNDTVSYVGRSSPMRIDLGQETNEDRLVGIRSIFGGEGDDVIAGDEHANELEGGQGRDRLFGGAGNDSLHGGMDTRPEELSGGPGDDRLTVEHARDRVSCGPGTDLLRPGSELVSSFRVPSDCERASFDGAFTVRGAPRRHGRFVYVRVDGVEAGGEIITAFAGRTLLARSREVTRRGVYRLRLNAAGRRLARRGRSVDLLTVLSRGGRTGNDPYAYRYRVR